MIKKKQKCKKALTQFWTQLVPHKFKVVKDLDSILCFPANLDCLRDDLICQLFTSPFDVVRKNIHIKIANRHIHLTPQIKLGQCGPLAVLLVFPTHDSNSAFLEKALQKEFYEIVLEVLRETQEESVLHHIRQGNFLPNDDKFALQQKNVPHFFARLQGRLTSNWEAPHLLLSAKNLKLVTKNLSWEEMMEKFTKFVMLPPKTTFVDVAREIIPLVDYDMHPLKENGIVILFHSLRGKLKSNNKK